MTTSDDKSGGLFGNVFKTASDAISQAASGMSVPLSPDEVRKSLTSQVAGIKQQIEGELLGRIKKELHKQFIIQWCVIVAGIGVALAIAILK
jgi:hypothetical protein